MAKRVEGEGGGDIVSAIVDNEAAVATSTEGRHVRRMPIRRTYFSPSLATAS